MQYWIGSAAVCKNNKNELLMVRGKHASDWSVPSGGVEEGESLEECCIREVKEETGYEVKVLRKLFVKEQELNGIHATIHYFETVVTNGSISLNDPDGIIVEVDWKSMTELNKLEQAYPEDKDFLVNYLLTK